MYLKTISLWTVMLFLQTLLSPVAVFADDKMNNTGEKRGDTNEKIRITAERMVSDSEAMWAEFIGNVEVVQGNDIIKADSLKIFYQSGSEKDKDETPGRESIKEIVATGNVTIHFDDKLAVSHRAVYTAENRVLVLSGGDSKVTSGRDSISGEKITLYRADGRIVVEGGSKKPVEAVLFPGEKGIK
jgi:lipopolysaccharide export system protein LptA